MSREFAYTIVAPDTELNRQVEAACSGDFSTQLFPTSDHPEPRRSRTMRSIRVRLGAIEQLDRVDPLIIDRLSDAQLIEIHWDRFLPLARSIRTRSADMPIAAIPYDVRSQRVGRRLETGPLASLQLRLLRRNEARLHNLCQLVSVFSEKDRRLLREMGVRTPVNVLDPPLDVPTDSAITAPSGATVLFMGAMDRMVNSNGAIWFIREVWPRVREHVPNARFLVVGADPREELRAMSSESVEITGWQDDLAPAFREASVFVAPLLRGAGLKFKVCQAMVYGLPVVTTPVGAEGIVDIAGRDAFGAVTRDPLEMGSAIIRLLRDPGEAGEIGARARRWATGHYSFERTIQAQVECYRRLIA